MSSTIGNGSGHSPYPNVPTGWVPDLAKLHRTVDADTASVARLEQELPQLQRRRDDWMGSWQHRTMTAGAAVVGGGVGLGGGMLLGRAASGGTRGGAAVVGFLALGGLAAGALFGGVATSTLLSGRNPFDPNTVDQDLYTAKLELDQHQADLRAATDKMPEIAQANANVLDLVATWDHDRNGSIHVANTGDLTKSELVRAPAGGPVRPNATSFESAPWIRRADANGDGEVTPLELVRDLGTAKVASRRYPATTTVP